MADDRLLAGLVGSPGKGRAVGVGEVKFRGDITPGTKCVRYEVDMRQVRRGRLALGIANGRVLADGAGVYLAKDMRVSLIALRPDSGSRRHHGLRDFIPPNSSQAFASRAATDKSG